MMDVSPCGSRSIPITLRSIHSYGRRRTQREGGGGRVTIHCLPAAIAIKHSLLECMLRHENFIRHYAAQSTAGYRLLPPSVIAPADLLYLDTYNTDAAVVPVPTRITRLSN